MRQETPSESMIQEGRNAVLLKGCKSNVYMKLETRYKKQEGEAPAAPILALNCWSL